MNTEIAHGLNETQSNVSRAVKSAFASLAGCAVITVIVLVWLGKVLAGQGDAGDLVGFTIIYAAVVALPAAAGIFYAALFQPGVKPIWCCLLGPISAGFGFVAKDVVHLVVDRAGLPRPGISDFVVGAVIAVACSMLFYYALRRTVTKYSHRLAA